MFEDSVNMRDSHLLIPPVVNSLGMVVSGTKDSEAFGREKWQRFRLVGYVGLPAKGFFRAKATAVAPVGWHGPMTWKPKTLSSIGC